MSFADKFKEARKAAHMSQQQVADKLGLDRSAISHYENGDSQPTFKNISKICEILNIPVEEIIEK